MATIAEARRAATAKREAREAEEAAAKAAAAKKPAKKAKSLSIIDTIRAAFSSADDISRIDAAVDAATGVDAVTQGVADADKRKDD